MNQLNNNLFLMFLSINFSLFSIFFRISDGKFILELASSKEGERCGWVSVPRKTYWPPAAPSNNNCVNHNKNENSTSLSCTYCIHVYFVFFLFVSLFDLKFID